MFQLAFCYAFARTHGVDFYYQSEHWFEPFKEEIKKILSENIIKSDYIAIHVRRGDYVGNPFYVDLMETDYYKKAMKEFEGEKFMVFSDNIDWCKAQQEFKDCEFSESKDEYEDFNKMAGCKGVIMANSSFSWWAGYLCEGKVVAPKDWYTDEVERTKLPDKFKVI